MNTRRCLKIATRIDALLQRELGQGVDATRMLAEPMYARDVLLVCEAMQGSELAELAPRFRAALVAAAEPATGARSTGFSASRFLSSLFGASTGSPASTLDPPPPANGRRWFGRSSATSRRGR